jgi:hypothetical protein
MPTRASRAELEQDDEAEHAEDAADQAGQRRYRQHLGDGVHRIHPHRQVAYRVFAEEADRHASSRSHTAAWMSCSMWAVTRTRT